MNEVSRRHGWPGTGPSRLDCERPPSFPSTGYFWPIGVFDADDLAVLAAAYGIATAFLGHRLSLTQRRDMATAIITHARSGLRDARRLAIKAIVAV